MDDPSGYTAFRQAYYDCCNPEIKQPIWECVKCKRRWFESNYDEHLNTEPIIWNRKTERAVCPRCTLKELESRFGRLGQ